MSDKGQKVAIVAAAVPHGGPTYCDSTAQKLRITVTVNARSAAAACSDTRAGRSQALTTSDPPGV
jgi:hypothetical protein